MQISNTEVLEKEKIFLKAREVLKENEKEGLIMPDNRYYEGICLWDTGFIEIGEAHIDPEKAAMRILKFLKKAQWKNGLVPHFLFFNQVAKNYTFGPDFWQTDKSVDRPVAPTSGITQPPVLAFATLKIFSELRKKSPEKANDFLNEVYPRLLSYHRYLTRERDPEKSGLVSIYHPWESGLDNSPIWESSLAMIPLSEEQIWEAKDIRKDIVNLEERLGHDGFGESEAIKLASEMRPSDTEYACYIYLVRFMADRGYDDSKIYKEVPFNIKDVLFNSIFIAANKSLLVIARLLEKSAEVGEIEAYLEKQKTALGNLYNEKNGLYYSYDVRNKTLIKRDTLASFGPLFAGVATKEQAEKMIEVMQGEEYKNGNSLFLIPSTSRKDPSFHERAYWKGPVWMPTSWLIVKGLERSGYTDLSRKMSKDLIELVSKNGFYEYYHPNTNEGLGMNNFSWTAALAIDLLKQENL